MVEFPGNPPEPLELKTVLQTYRFESSKGYTNR